MELHVDVVEGERLDDALAELLAIEPSVAYANFPAVAQRSGALTRYHQRRWRSADIAALVARRDDDKATGTVYLERRTFESEHFGVQMARIEAPAVVADEALRAATLRALYEHGLALLRERGYEHVAIHCPASDRVAGWVAQELGAFYVGTKISWMASLTGVPNDPLPANLRFETYERSAIATIDPASWKRLLEWSGEGFDRGPLVLDCGLPHDRARRVYQAWTEKAMKGEWAQAVLLVLDGSEVVGFHTMMVLPELSEAAGEIVLGRGIGGTLPGYHGLFSALQKETIARRPLGASYLENETQAANFLSINAFGRLGHPCFRSTANFHLRLRGKPARRTASATG